MLENREEVSMYAPVVIFCYNRKEHLEKTIYALEKNELANETDVYIYADGYRGDKDKRDVEEVRSFLMSYKKTSLFKSLTINISNVNKGLANSIIDGVSEIIKNEGRVIVLEDDLITAPDFLVFMNESLNYYKNDESIWSVTGYTLPLKGLKELEDDVYLSYRACSWAWGTWNNRWKTVDWEVKDFTKLCRDKKMQRQLNRGGREMFKMLKNQQEGKNNSWAIRWCYTQSKQNKYTIHPKYCKVQNIGVDGTGENSLATRKYITKIDKTPIMVKSVKPNKKILNQFRNYYKLTLEEIWVLGWARIKRDFLI